MIEWIDYLNQMESSKATDLVLSAGSKPKIRVCDSWHNIENTELLTNVDIKEIVEHLLPNDNLETLKNKFMIYVNDKASFNILIYRQKGAHSIHVRHHSAITGLSNHESTEKLIESISKFTDGLVLVAGMNRNGKSSFLYKLVEYINNNDEKFIIRIDEKPEFIHKHRQSIVDQIEVGVDSPTFSSAISTAINVSPDIIVIDSIDSAETMEKALLAAEKGYLIIGSIYASSVLSTIKKVLLNYGVFKPDIKLMLVENLKQVVVKKVISIPNKVIPYFENLIVTNGAKEVIENSEFNKINSIIETGAPLGMTSFESSLASLFDHAEITKETYDKERAKVANDKIESIL